MVLSCLDRNNLQQLLRIDPQTATRVDLHQKCQGRERGESFVPATQHRRPNINALAFFRSLLFIGTQS
jgi:hypothetical protein